MMKRFVVMTIVACLASAFARADPLPDFRAVGSFDEQARFVQIEKVRILTVASQQFDPKKPTCLIVYALPNGNSIEQTIGCREAQGLDWHFFIQHIGAQTRLLRQIDPDENVVIAYVEATADRVGKTWPGWRQQHDDAPQRVRELVAKIAAQLPGKPRISLVSHSGGGAFLWAYLDATDQVEENVSRIVFLDSDYSYSDEHHHGEKLLAWLRKDDARKLIVIAYDDRNIEFNGKKVVSDTGGSWRASQRMIDFLTKNVGLERSTFGDSFDTYSGLNGQIHFLLHRNPHNIILHTRLVGEMSGYVASMTMGGSHEHVLGEDVQYDKFIESAPFAMESAKPPAATTTTARRELPLPARPADALRGSAFIAQIAASPADREQAILDQLHQGNVPQFMRTFVPIDVKFTGNDGIPHIAQYFVTPDYVSIGSDADFVRMPMQPKTAQRIADWLDCSLPTRKMVDDIDARAVLRLAPQPMTAERTSPLVFLENNCFIETQRAGRCTGELICGIKKDIIITNRLQEKPGRVAIYGWRKLDGKPIQPLTIVHGDTYVDYSHGVRLVARKLMVDGTKTTIDRVLNDPQLCGLLSDEGVIPQAGYR